MKIRIPPNYRQQHVYAVGQPGQGKSSLLFAMALQDIRNDGAVAVLDPNGDLVDLLLEYIPASHKDKCIYLDGENCVALDIMSWETPRERERVAQDAVSMFKRLLSKDWSSRMDHICYMAVCAALEAREPFTSIHDILTDEDRRFAILERVDSQDVKKFWTNDFPSSRNKGTAIYPRDAAAPIITRLAPIIRDSQLHKLLSARTPKLKMADVIAEKKILLVNLKKMSEDAAKIFGSLIVSQIQKILWRRAESFENREPFFLYIDEFQEFSAETFPKLLAQGRKFNLCACLANQHPEQEHIKEIIHDIKGCISTYFFFKMDADHARVFSSQIQPYKPEALYNLAPFRAFFRSPTGSNAVYVRTPAPAPHRPDNYAQYVKDCTIREYGPDHCNTAPIPHTESNVPKSDNIEPGGRTSPPNKSKKRGA